MPVAQRLRCRVDAIEAHGERVYTVTLRPERSVPRFRAGQFLHLAIDPYDPSSFWPDSRAFSIASAPDARDTLRITYAVHGKFTARLERELVTGKEVWIKMPYGEFVIGGDRDVVLFAGGTGVTAFTAFLEGLPSTHRHSVTLAYGARTPALLIYRDAVERCVQRAPALGVSYFVERGDCEAAPDGRVRCHAGPISVDAVWPRLRAPRDTMFYISGPPAMLHGMSRDLRARDVSPEAIRIDAWE